MAIVEKPIRILSIDGGGMRGLIPALLIRRLDQLIAQRLAEEKRPRQPLASFFDIIAGTSTGAIIAAGLAGRKEDRPLASPDELIKFYLEDAAQVFRGHRWGLMGPKFEQKRLERRFAEICCNASLSDAAANLIIPAFVGNGAFLFRGGPNWPLGSQPDYHLRDVLLAATAAPYLFPPARITAIGEQQTHDFIDGGLFANNPSLHAYLEARELFGHQREILLLSLGTGNDFRPIEYHIARRWGILGWLNPRLGLPLIQVLMQGQSNDADRNLQRLMPDQRWYIRLDVHSRAALPSFDDASPAGVEALGRVAEQFIAENSELLGGLARRLISAGTKVAS
jgi:patatin-like phospholipase/acyl hydrolase